MTQQVQYVEGERISCGCCRGERGNRCTCWMHADPLWGSPAGVCPRHQHLATTAQPYNPARFSKVAEPAKV